MDEVTTDQLTIVFNAGCRAKDVSLYFCYSTRFQLSPCSGFILYISLTLSVFYCITQMLSDVLITVLITGSSVHSKQLFKDMNVFKCSLQMRVGRF